MMHGQKNIKLDVSCLPHTPITFSFIDHWIENSKRYKGVKGMKKIHAFSTHCLKTRPFLSNGLKRHEFFLILYIFRAMARRWTD